MTHNRCQYFHTITLCHPKCFLTAKINHHCPLINENTIQYKLDWHSFTHSIFIAPVKSITQKHSRHSTDSVPEFHAEVLRATASEGLVKGPCVEARPGFEPVTFRMKSIESTNAPPHPKRSIFSLLFEVGPLWPKLDLFATIGPSLWKVLSSSLHIAFSLIQPLSMGSCTGRANEWLLL